MRITRFLVIALATLISTGSYAACNTYTYYAVSSGNWGANIWSTTPNGTGGALPNFSTPTYNTCDIVNIYIIGYSVTVNTQVTYDALVTIYLQSTSSGQAVLAFNTGDKLKLNNSSSTLVLSNTSGGTTANPLIDPGSGGGNSNLIQIGGTNVWNAATGPISGTGTITQTSTCSSGTPTGSCSSLPVTLTNFDAKINLSSVSLNWSTASELNFNYFSLQRSSNGKDFNEIIQVKGHGTTNEQQNYSYEDKDPIIGRSYYRLTSNDFDGYQETFRTVSVEYHGGKKFYVSPNPTDGSSIRLYFNFDADVDGMVTIYDNLGFVVGSFSAGAEAIVFANALKSGVYLAKYSSSSFTKTERFFVK